MRLARFPNTITLTLLLAALSCATSAQELSREGVTPSPVTVAAPAPAAPAASAEATTVMPVDGAKDPASGIELHGLVRMLSGAMRGQRVIAVADPDRYNWSDLSSDNYKHATTLIEKLQVIAATQSDDDQPETPWNKAVIPFRVGGSYVIAPEKREGANADLRGLSVLDVTARGTLLLDSLLQMTPKQLAAIGSEEGLPVSSLSREAQAMLMRSFRPPLRIVQVKPSTYTDEGGMMHPSWEHNEIGRLEDPLDPSQVRVRAHLRLYGANFQSGTVGTTLGFRGGTEGLMFQPSDESYQTGSERGADLPIYQDVPNTYKPSDLEGRRYIQPFGLSGVWKVEDVVKRLSSNTGLKLKVWKLYKDRHVFIGAPQVTNGEVIDALRLCLTASWRKLGDTYLLAWDRMPLQAIQQLARETSEEATRQVRKRRTAMDSDPGWLQIVHSLRFSPDDPLGLTPEQKAKLFPTEHAASETRMADQKITFSEMTPEQQSFLRKQAETETIDLPEMGPDNPAVKRPYTDEDIRNTSLQPQGTVVVSISVPGHGWVGAAENWDGLSFNGWQLQRAADKSGEKPPRDILEGAPPEVREMLANMKPMPLPSATRAAIVPVLSPARLNELADEMKRCGLNVLFYPALYGGYATFPGKAFPLDPALRGEDGFAAAVSAMKPKGIKVVGYLNTLAWQNVEDRVHWLNKYPQWQDVDVLGRTRLQWAAEHPDRAAMMDGIGYSLAGYVRPTEPMVEARLKALVAEFATNRDAAGIAFAEMAPAAMQDFMPGRQMAPPPLGFALADRLAVFARTGMDPADTVSWNDYTPTSLRRFSGYMGEERPNPIQEHQALVTRLLADARARRKDWVTYTVSEAPSRGSMGRNGDEPANAALKPDIAIRSLFQFMDNQMNTSGLLFPITTRNFFASMMEMEAGVGGEMIPDSLLKLPSLAVYNLIWNTEARMKSRTLPLVALDFRTAPGAITETLKWVQPPEPSPGPQPALPKKSAQPAQPAQPGQPATATPKPKPAPSPAAQKARPAAARPTR